MSFWRVMRRSKSLLLPFVLLATMPGGAMAADPESPDGGRADRQRNYIVTLAVEDAGKPINPAGRNARQRIRRRAARAADATARLSQEYGFKPAHRYTSAVTGFSARLTPAQVSKLRRDGEVASIRVARRFSVAGQVVPTSLKRVKGAPGATPAPDTDIDIAILDTGIGPVGGNELNVQGGVNCSADGLGDDAWQDRFPGKHGTHVAGIAAARDNGIGAVGVAPGARLWSVRVFRGSGFGDESTIVCGLDWIVSTHGPEAPAGTRSIDVVNMSIQGARVLGAPEACGDEGDPDPIHVAVCAAHAAGISVVVAAGNDSGNAAHVSPAGYDQVITVAALSDFDGLGGVSAAADCDAFSHEVDDHYATYSNYGRDVDIVAPGTCVTSTYPSASGDDTQRLTGTSMATPHVTGAVARYLAANPGTTPNQMRKLIRASGRLDWQIASDPNWFGPNDVDAPNRVLDVNALMARDGLRVWLSRSVFKVGTDDTSRVARVDIQRIGGYGGEVQLGLDGLPAAVGQGAFDRSGPVQVGLGGLGARLVLSLRPSGPDGLNDLDVTASGSGGGPTASRELSLLVDRTGPDVVVEPARIRGRRSTIGRNGSSAIALRWSVTDELSMIDKTVLERKVGGNVWKSLGNVGNKSGATTRIKPGRSYRFRVRSQDRLGNATSRQLPLRISRRDSSSSQWQQPAGGWRTKTARAALGGSVLQAGSGAGSLTTSFVGRAVAVVAPVGPNRGRIRVRIDDGPWQTRGLKATRGGSRRVVFAARLAVGSHRLEIGVVQGQAAIDGIIVMR